eukprot:5207431-Pyramimonas_sp.AAC.1
MHLRRVLKDQPGSHSEKTSLMPPLPAAAGRHAGSGRTRSRIPPSGDHSSDIPSACCGPLLCLLCA